MVILHKKGCKQGRAGIFEKERPGHKAHNFPHPPKSIKVGPKRPLWTLFIPFNSFYVYC